MDTEGTERGHGVDPGEYFEQKEYQGKEDRTRSANVDHRSWTQRLQSSDTEKAGGQLVGELFEVNVRDEYTRQWARSTRYALLAARYTIDHDGRR